MRNEADQLLEDLEYIRTNAGSFGPDHPKVKKWVAEVREYLRREKNSSGLKKFERLEFVKGRAEMWSQDNPARGNIGKYQAQLDTVKAVLGKMTDASGQSSADQKMRELFLTPEQGEEEEQEALQDEDVLEMKEEAEVATQVEALVEKALAQSEEREKGDEPEGLLAVEKTMDQKIEPSFETVTKQHLSPSAREKAVDQLMAELGTEMKSLDPDWEKIQRVMSSMMGLKKTGELLDRLKAEANNPEVKWEAVRKVMAQLWSIKKEIVIDLLPTLLKV